MLDFSEDWSTEKCIQFAFGMPGDTNLDRLAAAYVEVENTIRDLLTERPEDKHMRLDRAYECRACIESLIAYEFVITKYAPKNRRLVKR